MPRRRKAGNRNIINRREFLAAAGAGAAYLAVGCRRDAEPSGADAAAVAPQVVQTPAVMAGLPTATTAILNVFAPYGGPCRIDLGTEIDKMTRVSEIERLSPHEPVFVTLRDLSPRTRYFYRVIPTDMTAGVLPATGAFKTAHVGGTPFKFTLATDSFLLRDEQRADTSIFGRVLNWLTVEEPDFHVSLGNEAITHAPVIPDYVASPADADAVYTHLRGAYAPILRSTPLALVLGNHEGESWIDAGRGHGRELATWSRAARTRFLANPTDTWSPLGGSPHGNYYAWTWGTALFVVLDPFTYSSTQPAQPEDWTLGSDQFAWLENILATSPQPWKFVLQHQLVGGARWGGTDPLHAGPLENYGRGGAALVEVGEQARIHELLVKHGVQFVFKGHDQVYAHEECDSVHYITCGRLFGDDYADGPPWSVAPEFAELYPDGFAVRPGYLQVSVSGEGVRVRYVSTGREFLDEFEVRQSTPTPSVTP